MGLRRAVELSRVLFFELFPLFVMVVSVIVGIVLFVRDREARRRGED